MLDFKEDFLQFLWQHKLFLPRPFITASGKEIQVLKPGELNTNSGPDFFNAHIKINELVLVGNIEIHLKTSDWIKHGHVNDKNYNTLILHVVYENDLNLDQNIANNVEVLEVKNLINNASLDNYKQLFQSKQSLACSNQLKHCPDVKFLTWVERLCIERLEQKVNRLEQWYTFSKNDFSQSFYFCLLRNFGFKVNADAFELLAKQIPLPVLLKHSHNLLQLESLLIGTAGLLNGHYQHEYIFKIQNEYEFLKNKYRLIPLQKELFKFSRMRPANFPTLRLAQLAKLIHHCPELFSKPHLYFEFSSLYALLNLPLNDYWQHHYHLNTKATNTALNLGKTAIENIMINTFAPFLFFYSKKTNNELLSNKAVKLLQACAFEKNSVTKLYAAKNALLQDASQSQGLLQLYENYCKTKQCLSCGIAAALLKPITNV